jgi:hypothetical protein
MADARVVHQHVKPPELFMNCLARLLALRFARHIEADKIRLTFGRPNPIGGSLPTRFIAITNEHLRTSSRENLSDGCTNA